MTHHLKRAAQIIAMLTLALVPLRAQQTTVSQPPKQVPGYVIGPTDVIRVTVFSGGVSQDEFRRADYTVQNNGLVQLPLIKPIQLAGLTVTGANSAVRKALIDAKQFEECNVDITLIEYHSAVIKVQGAVRNPGNIKMTADRMNINDALNAAGNLTPQAGAQIRVRRATNHPSDPSVLIENGMEIYSREDLNSGALTDVQLFDNDTIDVPVAPQFFVQGLAVTTGEFQWEPNLTLERALLKAQGIKPEGAKNRILVRRMDPRTKEYKDVKDYGKNKDAFIIEPNDVIVVPKRRM